MIDKTKILIVISNLEFGGAQRQIVELVNNINHTQFDIHVCSLSNYVPLAEQFVAGTPLHIIHKKYKFDFSVVFKLVRLIRRYQFDVVHSFLFDAEIAARLAGKLSCTGIRIIGSERNANYRLKKIQKRAYRLTAKMVDLVVANSQSGAEYNAEQTGLAADKYQVIYNGVDTNRFKPACQEMAREKLGIDKKVKLIGMFASFKQQKNHPLLLQALQQLKAAEIEFKLLLVGEMLYGGLHGSDTYSARLKQQIKDSQLENDIICLGNQNEVENIYPACDFTVLPSLFEGTPNVILESMACGVPAIATRVSDNHLIIEHGVSGAITESNNVLDLAENIKQFIIDSAYLKKLSVNARLTVEARFSSIKLAENLQKIYSNSQT